LSHRIHDNHDHVHGPGCGHQAVQHDGHTDYLHDGHLHYPHDGHVDEHAIGVDAKNPAKCGGAHGCGGHDSAHKHGPACGHARVPHGDHVDYLVAGHLHNDHAGHCDDHGTVTVRP
jgi:hypothetical protein